MSSYTTQLRFIIEQKLRNEMGLPYDEEHWHYIYDFIGLADYPIFNEDYRNGLNIKIIRHYYTREIGAETVARFRMFMRDAMWLIMPYYNQLYESELLAKNINPLQDWERVRKEHAWGNTEADSFSNSTSSGNNQSVFSDTPQSEMIPAQIKNMQYATNVTLDEGSNTENSDASSQGKYDNMVERNESGYSRPQTELLLLYRDTFLNIDRSIIEDKELAECFMTIW